MLGEIIAYCEYNVSGALRGAMIATKACTSYWG